MNAPPPFVIFTLPRSRSVWLSRFLTCGPWICEHDQARYVRSVDDVRSWFSLPFYGSVETAAAPFWRLARHIRPDLKIVVVRRPVDEVAGSLLRTGVEFDRAALEAQLVHMDRKLDQIAYDISVDFADLSEERTCQRIFEYCLGLPHDRERWTSFHRQNLQIDLATQLNYVRAYGMQLCKAEATCVRATRAVIRGAKFRPGPVDARGISIQQERLGTFIRDGVDLFSEHCMAVGEEPDEWTRKNIPMIEQLESGGCWQFMTARSNGRMLAYLMTLVGPSIEKVGRVSATQTLFFASRDAQGMGLGMALQQASIADLRSKGVHEVIMRDGIRGAGGRLNILYRRLGADDFGHLWKLQLKAA